MKTSIKTSASAIGFIQAAGLTLYVIVFALVVSRAQSWFRLQDIQPEPRVSIILFLLAFVISVLVCGSVILGYPTIKFFDGKRAEALKTILWNGIWLVVIFLGIAILGLLIS